MSHIRILIVKLSSLGDILHVLPTVQALHDQLDASIDWAVQPEYCELVSCFTCVSNTIPVPRHGRLRHLRATLAALRAQPYDMVVDLHGLCKSAWVTRAARAPRRIGPSYARELSWLAYSERSGKPRRQRHHADQALDLLDHLGLVRPATAAVALRYPSVPLPPAQYRLALAPVSRWRTKDWPLTHYQELVRTLATLPGVRLFVVGARADHAVAEKLVAAAPAVTENLCGQLTLPQLFGALNECDLLIANDTGPVHVAAALGRPCLVLFGPTRPELTGPYGPGHRVLTSDVPCRPCMSRRCRRGDHICLQQITPQQVATAACDMLGVAPTAGRSHGEEKKL